MSWDYRVNVKSLKHNVMSSSKLLWRKLTFLLTLIAFNFFYYCDYIYIYVIILWSSFHMDDVVSSVDCALMIGHF